MNPTVTVMPLATLAESVSRPVATGSEHAAPILGARCGPIEKPSNRETRGLKLTSLEELLSEPAEETGWLSEGLLVMGGSSLLAAKPKTGKTTLARDLACCVSRGEPFLGRRTKQGRVLALFLEEKRSQVRKQFEAMGAIAEGQIFFHIGAAPQDALPWLAGLIQRYEPSLVIVDPLFKFTRVTDGNSYSEVCAALEPLTELARENDCHILCLHHQGKGDRSSGDSVLGSTAIFAAVDTLLILSRHDDLRSLRSMQRYGEDMPETVLQMDERTGLIGAGGRFEEMRVDATAEKIRSALSSGQPMTEDEIREAVGGDESLCSKSLRRETGLGLIVRTGPGKRGNPYRYALLDSRCSVNSYSGTENTNRFDFGTET